MARRRIKRLLSTRKRTKPREKTDRCEKTERWVSALIIPFGVIGLLAYYSLQDSADRLKIYPQAFSQESFPEPKFGVNGSASADEKHHGNNSPSSQTDVTVEGIVLKDLKPVSEYSVFATMISNEGPTYAVGSSRTKDDGEFRIRGNLNNFNSFIPKELVNYAKSGKQEEQAEKAEDHTTNSAYGRHQQRNVKIPPSALGLLLGIFLLSLWVAFVRAKQVKWKRLKHFASVLLAFLFTLSVICIISSGINYVHAKGKKGEILSLGYAFLFQHSYADACPKEWIFSFTLPKKVPDSNSSEKEVQRSGIGGDHKSISAFGAPLWVILLSVIGASITTVSLIVRETKETPDYENDKHAFWQRIQDIVQHQFLILFAPLGAIFVYQSLVAADAVNNSLTVALAALGAGPTVNYLLTRSIKLSKDSFDKVNQ